MGNISALQRRKKKEKKKRRKKQTEKQKTTKTYDDPEIEPGQPHERLLYHPCRRNMWGFKLYI